MFKVEKGECYIFFGVVSIWIGRVRESWLGGCELDDDCSWVQNMGDDLSAAMKNGTLTSTQRLYCRAQPSYGALQSVLPWKHSLPK